MSNEMSSNYMSAPHYITVTISLSSYHHTMSLSVNFIIITNISENEIMLVGLTYFDLVCCLWIHNSEVDDNVLLIVMNTARCQWYIFTSVSARWRLYRWSVTYLSPHRRTDTGSQSGSAVFLGGHPSQYWAATELALVATANLLLLLCYNAMTKRCQNVNLLLITLLLLFLAVHVGE